MTTLTPYVSTYLRERRSAGTLTKKSCDSMRYRLATLDRSFGNRPVNQLTHTAIDRWMLSIGNLAPASRCAYLATAAGFGRWMVKKGTIKKDPTIDSTRPRVPRPTPRALGPAAIGAARAACCDDRERIIVALMHGIGMRACEVAWARAEEWDPQGRILRFKGKNAETREIPVTDALAASLERWLDGRRTGPLVPSQRDGGHVSPTLIGRLATDVLARAGLKRRAWDGVSAHALRHTAASDTLDACNDLRVVQELLGHRQLSTTQIYLRRAGREKMRQALELRDYGDAA